MFEPTEEVIAELFEELIQSHFDVTVGLRTRKDATDGSDLRVDFVYEEAQPQPLALEVTSLPTGWLFAAHSAGEKWTSKLDEIAKSERLGLWRIHYSAETDIKQLVDVVADVLRQPNADEYRDPENRFSLSRTQSDTHGVAYLGVMGGVTGIGGFSADLLNTALDNAVKLSEARPRQTHLIVRVALNRSRDQTLTLVPPNPEQLPQLAHIDWIWVVFNTDSQGMGDRPWAWWARPGNNVWNVQIGSL
ncbi:MAG: hypothetical protein IH943_06920 [Acidobacteria bacterium]|nr:hypothetical protein [Acidobacteriota bacterium]